MSVVTLLSSAPGILGLVLLLLVGLPLVVAVAVVHWQDSEEKETPWWHAASMAQEPLVSKEEDGSSVGQDRDRSADRRLVGGSRNPEEQKCQQCGGPGKERCTGCRSAFYCSRQCQQKDWTQGHKHECKKLRKQQNKLVRSAAHAADSSSAAETAAEAASSRGGNPLAARPEDSNSALPAPKQVLYPYDKYLQLATSLPHRKRMPGLQNVGNSCYANSLLQSLLATPALAAYLASGEHSQGCLRPSPSEWCVLCELEKLAQQAYQGTASVLNPRPLLRNVKKLGRNLCFGRQEDSHELYLRLMEAVEAVQLLEAGGKAKYDLRSRETTLIHHVFAGYTRGQIECLSCGHVSRTYECCTSLTLEVSPRITSLEAALRRFTASERLDGDNRYKCDGCKSYVAADRSTRLEVAPNALQICLKRFAPGRYGKITSRLSFPEELDLSPYMAKGCLDSAVACASTGSRDSSAETGGSNGDSNSSGSASGTSESLLYSLYAVVVHIDWGRSTDYGHYIAYVRSGSSWYQCDDSSVTQVAAAKALAAGAYLLFYQRNTPRALVTAAHVSNLSTAVAGAPQQQQQPDPEAALQAAGTLSCPAADGSQHLKDISAMLRVETAPASLPHLAGEQAKKLGQAAAAAPMGEAGTEEDAEEQQGEEQQQASSSSSIEVGTPERLHVSASLSDLAASRSSAAAATAAGALYVQHAASVAAAQRQEPVDVAQQQPAGVAAVAATEELPSSGGEQQRAQDVEHAAGDVGAASSPASLSSDDESGSVGASANPYALLVDDDEEGDQGGENINRTSSSSASEEEERPQSAAAVLGGDAESASAAGEGCAEQQAAESGCAAADSSSEAQQHAAHTSQQAQQPDDEVEGGCAQQHSAQHVAQQQQLDKQQGAADAQSEVQSAASSSAAAIAAHSTPKHRASVSSHSGGKRVLRVSIDLPGVEQEGQVDWQVAQAGSSMQQLLLHADKYVLHLPLPVPVATKAGKAKWAPSRHKLSVTWPVVC